jgi:hypothetical protein
MEARYYALEARYSEEIKTKRVNLPGGMAETKEGECGGTADE